MEAGTRALSGAPIAESLLAEVRATLARAPPGSRPPTLASVHLRSDGPFEVYRRRQERTAASLGIRFRDEPIDPPAGPAALAARVEALAGDPSVHAILVEHPLPPPFDAREAMERIPLAKDVDGLSAGSLGRLWRGVPVHVPAVARAVAAIVDHYGLIASGDRAVVIGRSDTVGLPIAHLLLARGRDATVTVAHSRTPDLATATVGARLVVGCVGRPGLLDRRVVPRGAAVVDVGLSTVPDPERPGRSRSIGDADAAVLDGWAGALTPVPGGVGPVTVASLMGNVARAWARQEGLP
ncbi:MAG: bifunctional 5,10-methylenetetrahydrofolate dehydrogenase/5,10-methenyltetrahydrofolate cyclohydrolase [Thermoplasmata archaeon]